jgi:hypothetical protein
MKMGHQNLSKSFQEGVWEKREINGKNGPNWGVCFDILCAEFLEESFVVVVWWSYIVLVSAYHGRPSLLHLF